jgi:hypothetical protein
VDGLLLHADQTLKPQDLQHPVSALQLLEVALLHTSAMDLLPRRRGDGIIVLKCLLMALARNVIDEMCVH